MSLAFPKPPSRAKVKHDKDTASERSWQIVRKMVLGRDSYVCRAASVGGCIGPLDVHHWRLRSTGGEDIPRNLITLCRFHHQEMHNWRLFADAKSKQGADGVIGWSTT